jgi:hypothetical protein
VIEPLIRIRCYSTTGRKRQPSSSARERHSGQDLCWPGTSRLGLIPFQKLSPAGLKFPMGLWRHVYAKTSHPLWKPLRACLIWTSKARGLTVPYEKFMSCTGGPTSEVRAHSLHRHSRQQAGIFLHHHLPLNLSSRPLKTPDSTDPTRLAVHHLLS